MIVGKYKDKIIKRDEIITISKEIRTKKKTIVTTNGCFDLLHLGHIDYLQRASELGDYLIIGINSQDSVKILKGDSRPVNDELSRISIVAALGFVDFCFIFNEDTPVEFLKEIKPDVHVKGGDYNAEELVEKRVVEDNGGVVKVLPFLKAYSTSNIINKIQNS